MRAPSHPGHLVALMLLALGSSLAPAPPAHAAAAGRGLDRLASPRTDLAGPATLEAADVTVLGAAIVERPAPVDSLPAGRTGQRRWRRLSFSPHGHDRCEYFVVFEVSGARAAMDTRDALDAWFVSHGLAVMANLDPDWAVGGGVQFHWATGNFKLAPELRVRRWFGREQSVEAAFGWFVHGDEAASWGDRLQQAGPIASLRYSPHPLVFVQGGFTRYREFEPRFVPPLLYEASAVREESRVFVGLGFTGKAGLVALGAEAVTLLSIGFALAGMN